MFQYVLRRILYMIPTLILIAVVSFIIIQLPPGDFLTSYIAQLSQTGETVDEATIAALRKRYGLDQPYYVQFFMWVWGMLHGDFGQSFEWNRPVSQLIWERLALTVAVSTFTMVFTWILSFPIGLYSATHQYSGGDYFFTFLGYIGLATPNFMIALILMWIAYSVFGASVGGLFSPQYVEAAWSWGKFLDMLNHLWIPAIVIGMGGTAGLIRTLRANLLDELHKPYVVTARAKGVPERTLLWRYPLRIAIIPWISTVGWSLPGIISGETITAVVLSLPTTGPLLLRALQSQDMYLAGSFIMLLSFLTVIGTLISDILLGWVDPRIRYE
ncbi:MAG TPA: ABC transporter permease [bacterium]|nr:ABC transporter permease [bacterium]HPO82833.1 ABC transporter permease [bacterium]HRR91944.1 ABC transporter permease [bacterium]